MQIIGYSIRPDDYHSRALLYPRLVRGARRGRLRVAVVDRAQDAWPREETIGRFAGARGPLNGVRRFGIVTPCETRRAHRVRSPCHHRTIFMPARIAIAGREAVWLTRPL